MQFCTGETTVKLFEKQVDKTPNNIALHFGKRTLTYSALNEQSNQLAYYLREQGIGREDIIAICMERSINMIVAIIGILKAGAAYLPLDPIYPSDYLADIVSDAKPGICITQSALSPKIVGLSDNQVDVYCLDINADQLKDYGVENPVNINHANDLMYVIYTSGTTGKPKGVLIEHQQIMHLLKSTRMTFDFISQDKWALFFSYAFDVSVWELWGALSSGAQAVIVPYLIAKDANRLHTFLVEHKISVLIQTPSTLNTLKKADASKKARLGLRYLIVGGEALLPYKFRDWMNKYGDEEPVIINIYGITETAVCTTYRRIWRRDVYNSTLNSPIGQPLPGVNCYVLDENHQPVSAGSAGELYVGGAGLARGYLNRFDLTDERFIDISRLHYNRVSSIQEKKLYKTGDFVSQLENGEFVYIGRADEQVKIRGFRVELAYIERCLLEYVDINQCVILTKVDKQSARYLIAYLSLAKDGQFDLGELQNYLKTKLPWYMIPTLFMKVDKFPVTANGKINKKALLKVPSSELLTSSSYVAPKGEQEYKLCQIWKTNLQAYQVGIKDNFFLSGGNSLIAAQVALEVNRDMGFSCDAYDVLLYPTVETLLQYLKTKETRSEQLCLLKSNQSTISPMSFAQQRLWLAYQDIMGKRPEAYNVKFSLQFRGNLDKTRLKKALQTLVNRHDTLRTYFPGFSKQRVATIDLDLRCETLSGDEAYSHHKVQSLIDKLSRKQFGNLSRAPLFEFTLIEVDETQFVLAMVFHHTIIDGFSVPVLVKELTALYNSQTCEPLVMQYSDYAKWEQAQLKHGDYDTSFHYWKNQLAGATAILDLPTDKIRSKNPTYHAKSHFFCLSAPLTQQLQVLASQQSVTLFVLLLTSIAVLLYRYTQQDDFTIGIASGERPHPDLKSLVGFFVNMLPIRFEQKTDMRFIDMLQKASKTTLDAYANNVPLENIIEQLKLPHYINNHPLFQVSVAMHTLPDWNLDFDDISATFWDESLISASDMQAAKFELSFEMEVLNDGRLAAKIEYATDLFNADSIERMACYWTKLCEEIALSPEADITALSLMTESQKNRLITQWSQQIRSAYPKSSVLAVFQQQVKQYPDQIAIIDGDVNVSYQVLNQRANQLANHLLATFDLSIPENIIAVLMERSADFIVSILAVLKTGSAYLPLDPELPNLRLQFMVQDANSHIVITKAIHESCFIDCDIERICLDDPGTRLALSAQLTDNPDKVIKPNNLAYLIYTSGSTGQPKGVMIEHNSIVQLVKNTSYVDLSRDDKIAQAATAAFDAYTFEVWGAILNNSCIVICPKETLLDITQFEQFLRTNKITILFVTTVLCYRFLQSIPETLSTLKYIIFGGESLSIEDAIVSFFNKSSMQGRHLTHIYGPTENTTFSIAYDIQNDFAANTKLPIGKSIQTTQSYILDDHYQPVAVGMIGDLYLGGDGLARGYLNQPVLTREKFISGVLPNDITRLYKTGDKVYCRNDGNIIFVGRADQQVKLSGYRVELSEIEKALLSQPMVAEAVVVKHVTESKQNLIAYFTMNRPVEGDINQLKFILREKLTSLLPHYMLPSAFVPLEKLPLTNNGKIDYERLPLAELQDHKHYIPPSTAIEELIAVLWQETLRVEQKISVVDDFFMMGGNSLLAMQLAHRINQQFGAITYSVLFAKPTIKAQAELIEIAEHDRQKPVLSMNYFCKEALLDEDIVLSNPSKAVCLESPNAIFITGVTGFLGAFLLEELLTTSSASIYCLLRAKHLKHAKEGFDNMVTKYQLQHLKRYANRIKLIVGDITKPFLGLSKEEYMKLALKIDLIYHCASDVNFVKPYSALKETNVIGTKNVLRFAIAEKTKLLQYISTMAVFSFSHFFSKKTVLKEEDVVWDDHMTNSLPYDIGYVQSKAVAEKLVWQAKERDIPVTIHRLGFILCHSKTGVSNTQQLWAGFLKDCVALGSYPDFTDLKEEFITVDYASKAIIHIAQQADNVGKIFHIVPSNEHNITTNKLFDMVLHEGYSLKKESFYFWRDRWLHYISDNNSNSALRLLAPLFTDPVCCNLTLFEIYQKNPIFDNTQVLNALEMTEVVEKPINADIIDRYLSYLMSTIACQNKSPEAQTIG